MTAPCKSSNYVILNKTTLIHLVNYFRRKFYFVLTNEQPLLYIGIGWWELVAYSIVWTILHRFDCSTKGESIMWFEYEIYQRADSPHQPKKKIPLETEVGDDILTTYLSTSLVLSLYSPPYLHAKLGHRWCIGWRLLRLSLRLAPITEVFHWNSFLRLHSACPWDLNWIFHSIILCYKHRRYLKKNLRISTVWQRKFFWTEELHDPFHSYWIDVANSLPFLSQYVNPLDIAGHIAMTYRPRNSNALWPPNFHLRYQTYFICS